MKGLVKLVAINKHKQQCQEQSRISQENARNNQTTTKQTLETKINQK